MTVVHVFHEKTLVGYARAQQGDHFSFEYAPGWLESTGAFPLSLYLPLRQQPFEPAIAHPYFANLLPEGGYREAVCRRLGISIENDVELLRAIGDDTAGALRFVSSTGRTNDQEQREVRISEDELSEWSEGAPTILQDPSRPPRLSMAGAQHKTGVTLREGQYYIPPQGVPTTHILKFDARDYPHLASNEFLTTRLASALGLPVVQMRLDARTARPFLVVSRYDRITNGKDGVTTRLHQEDFCQVFGLSPRRKYENEGGPTLSQISDVIRRHSAVPASDLLHLGRWAIFCAIAGNADGHAKNLSLLYSSEGLRLASFYDLVCTRVFPRLDRTLAMSIGGQRDPDKLRTSHFSALARSLGVRPRLILSVVDRFLTEVEPAMAKAAEELVEFGGAEHVVDSVRRVITKRVRAIGNNLVQDRS